MGEQIHDEIVSRGLLKNNVVLGNVLVDMYAKCGVLLKALKVFDALLVRDAVSWNALIAGYAQQGRGQEALGCFQRMRSEGFSPSAITYACVLKACGIMQDVDMGEQIHDEIVSQGLLRNNVVLGNVLVDMYAKCGVLLKAQKVFDGLLVRDVISWNVLIAGYAQKGQGREALGYFQQMQRQDFRPNSITYACVLKACGITQDIDTGQQIHDEIISQGLLKKNVVLGGALVDMYAKCGVLLKAQSVFDGLPIRDAVCWNALIGGYIQQGQGQEALGCFQRMQSLNISPDALTYAYVLKACGIMQDVDVGKQIHDEIVNQGLLKKDIVLGTALVDMYAKCGALVKAHQLVDEFLVSDAIAWTTLITGYVQHGQVEEALGCFYRMQSKGLSPSAFTYSSILKACGIMQDVEMGKEIHKEIVSQGLLKENVVLGNALVDMYAKCGALLKAQIAFDTLPVRDVISWNALIAGYAQQGQGQEALGCFQRMRSEGFAPTAITYACILKACGITQDVDVGKKIHDEIVSQGLLKNTIMLGNALIDMYAKCGVLLKAQMVFDTLPVRDVISWNALIAGYAQYGQGQEARHCFQLMRSMGFSPNVVSWTALIGGYAQQGLAKEALDCFQWMQQEGISPDAITFVNVLNACSHSGLVDEGQMCFDNMRTKHGIAPNVEHHTCMVDLFGRAKLFDKAMRVIRMMPSSDHPSVWSALLGACRKWGNVKLALFSFERLVQLDRCNAAAYVLMSNIYAAAGMQEEAENIECMRIKNAAWKQPGCTCWIDVSGNVHKFVVGDSKHPQSREIYAKLQDLELKLSQQGYSPSLHWVSQNLSADSKTLLLCQHSEKLAIACAIINTPQGTDIRVTKNMRVCGDCHDATSLISKIEKRKIMVKDAARLHIFESGKCSCGDYH
ncbi:hypothetical protein GOP47_0018237 [Adiantum capillus-veneris]|uniref:DYW domain-containing protein n=1 Tax=Adiantum capillus-veneris TaxID=13818 RepID=A0A9D4UHT9_ADICA|nr:hypothetical protein GOP47_0018237 [Adiantum capillus-veneris]